MSETNEPVTLWRFADRPADGHNIYYETAAIYPIEGDRVEFLRALPAAVHAAWEAVIEAAKAYRDWPRIDSEIALDDAVDALLAVERVMVDKR